METYINPTKLMRKEDYQKVVDSTNPIEHQDFNPILVDNIFTEEDIKHIYEVVNATPLSYIKVAPWGGQASWLSTHFDKKIEEKINKLVHNIFGDELVLAQDYSFVRYSEEYGYKPKLFPHADKRDRQKFLLDIQIRADQEWGIIVEDTLYKLKDNQGLIFSGTNQQHWREDIEISPHARIDMLFCNLEFKDLKSFPEDYDQIMHKRSGYLRGFYNLDDTPKIADRKINELQ